MCYPGKKGAFDVWEKIDYCFNVACYKLRDYEFCLQRFWEINKDNIANICNNFGINENAQYVKRAQS